MFELELGNSCCCIIFSWENSFTKESQELISFHFAYFFLFIYFLSLIYIGVVLIYIFFDIIQALIIIKERILIIYTRIYNHYISSSLKRPCSKYFFGVRILRHLLANTLSNRIAIFVCLNWSGSASVTVVMFWEQTCLTHMFIHYIFLTHSGKMEINTR